MDQLFKDMYKKSVETLPSKKKVDYFCQKLQYFTF